MGTKGDGDGDCSRHEKIVVTLLCARVCVFVIDLSTTDLTEISQTEISQTEISQTEISQTEI